MKTAIITGVTGQDGSYLAEYLLSLNYIVIGVARRKSTNAENWGLLEHLKDNPNFELKWGDIKDSYFMSNLLTSRPNELYLLAAQSHVAQSFKEPLETFQTDAMATLSIMSIVKDVTPETKVYFAATSELYGGLNCPLSGYTEQSSFHPRSPYAIAKLASYWTVVNFREAYGLRCCSGILFNHGSPRRGLDFVERKITNTVAKIKLGITNKLTLGNLEAYRDLGHSNDFIKAMYLMLQQEHLEEFVIATGETHQISEIVSTAFRCAELNPSDYIHFDDKFLRPSEVPYLLGNPSKAKLQLEWKPSYNFESLIEEMYKCDFDLLCK